MNRFRNKKLIILLVVVGQILFLAGCRSSKTVVRPDEPTQVAGNESYKMTTAQRFDSVAAGIKDYDCFAASFKISINKPQRISFNGRAYVERDKSIYLSLRKFGMEVARLYLTNDSLVAVDKFNRRYVAESLSSVLASCPVTVGDIQSLLTGQPFAIGDSKLNSVNFETSEQPDNGRWIAIPGELPDGFESGFLFSLDTNDLLALAVRGGATTFLARYTGIYQSPAGPVSGNVAVGVTGSKIPLELDIEWTWTGAAWNKPSDMRQFVYPDRDYKRIAAADLLKMM